MTTPTQSARASGQTEHTMRIPKDSGDENPETLCANWRDGCNGVTDGPTEDGHLTLCDDCRAAGGVRSLQCGDLLKWSEAAIRPLRDWWLTQGRHEPKANAKASLDAKARERMTYLRTVKGRFCTFIVYRQGAIQGRCMPHMVERAND